MALKWALLIALCLRRLEFVIEIIPGEVLYRGNEEEKQYWFFNLLRLFFCSQSSFLSEKTLESVLVYNTVSPGRTCKEERKGHHNSGIMNCIPCID